MKMVLIPPGSFEMGSEEKEQFRAEDEVLHEVTLTDGFYISETEITQLQWENIMKSNPSEFKGVDLPVENISWVDTQKFINELNVKSNQRYRLPTEAEWEFACRAGSMLAFNLEDKEAPFAWDKLNSNEKTHPVKQLKTNAFGLYDMHNNVWEWCQDYYDSYNTTIIKNPQGALESLEKVMRGGSYSSLKASSRSATRRSRKTNYISSSLGFRIVLELETNKKSK
jgi:formylglycine-generating enzyme required for sulfatase activity